jgi:hypothetical protein
MKKSQDQDHNRSRDLGTSSDRAMYGPSEERGRGSSSERNQEGKDHQQRREDSQQQYGGGTSEEAGGVTNRDLSRDQQERQGSTDRGKTRDKER